MMMKIEELEKKRGTGGLLQLLLLLVLVDDHVPSSNRGGDHVLELADFVTKEMENI
jgi:hypothetical protein